MYNIDPERQRRWQHAIYRRVSFLFLFIAISAIGVKYWGLIILNDTITFVSFLLGMFIGLIVCSKQFQNKFSRDFFEFEPKRQKPSLLFRVIVPPILGMFVGRSLPTALYLLNPVIERDTRIVVVKSKPMRFSRYGIWSDHEGPVIIQGHLPLLNEKVSGIERSEWNKIAVGDELLLEGEKNLFGFRIRSIHRRAS